MDARKRAPGRAFCPQCGQKYAVPEDELKRHEGLRFRATCRTCQTPFSVRWQDDGLITDIDELEQADEAGSGGRNVLSKGSRVGKYEIEKMLASGGSATVYRAFEMGANRTVALKVLHQVADSDYGVRFRREVEVQGNLKHPNLMPIFDQGTIDKKPYYTMELLHKPTALETIVTLFRDRRLAYNPSLRTLDSLPALLRRVLLPVARAIEFANANGVIHRDLKPGNVIVDARTLHVYVIDFGICHLTKKAGHRLILRGGEAPEAREERKREAMGTVRFMPPEQARGEIDETGDIWQLGALLHYIMSGDSPIAPAIDLHRVSLDKRVANLRKIAASSREAGDSEEAAFYERRIHELGSGSARTMKDVLKDAQEGRYSPPPDGADAALTAIARRAMEPDPKRRYRTAEDFATELLRYLDGRPVRAYMAALGPGKAALYRGRLHVRRNRIAMIATSIALLLGLALVVFLLVKSGADRRQQVSAWVREAKTTRDPVVQEDRLTRALALQPDHEEAMRLLGLARKYIPVREKLRNARAVREKVGQLLAARQYDAAARLAEDTAAVLEGSVLPDLRSLPRSYPGRRDEGHAQELADFLRGRRMVRVTNLPRGVNITLIPPRSQTNPALRWQDPRYLGTAVKDYYIESGSYVMVFSRENDPRAVYLPFSITHRTPQRKDLACPIDPYKVPGGMLYISAVRAMRYGDLRFVETTRRVTLKPFFLDAHEVTNEAYAAYLNALEPSRRERAVPRRLLPGPGYDTDPLWTRNDDGTWSYPEGTADHPVTSISMLDAGDFALRAQKRLPRPEEWEHAARGIDGRDYPFGIKLDPKACNAATGSVAAAGKFAQDRSPFGVYDMGGNVAEWTGTAEGQTAMVKGGSFDLPRYRVIATSFGRRRADLTYVDVGFRCAKDVE